MGASPRPSAFVLLAGLAAMAAVGAGGYLLLRTDSAPPAAPAPVPAKPAPAPAAAPLPAPPPRPKAPEASLTGRVLQGAEGEEAVAGATVEVYAGEGDPVPFLVPLAKGEAGADGRFSMAGFEKDRSYRVLATREGMAAASTGAVGGGAPVELRLLEPTFVAGTVKDAETKEPLSGARVVVADAVGATTGPDGAYRLEGIPASATSITASAPGYAPTTRALVAKKAGRTGLVLLLNATTTVSGVVLAPDGAPAPDAEVTVVEYTDVPMAGKVQTGSQETKSGPDGKFRVEEVPLGKVLEVSAKNGEGFSAPVAAGPLQKGKPAEGLVLQLAPGATLVVTVTDEAGKPVEGAEVTQAPEEKKDPEDGSRPRAASVDWGFRRRGGGTPTDAAGVARVRPVPPGRTMVAAHKEDFLRVHDTVEAAAGAETPVALRLAAGSAITGKVVDDLGNPLPDAHITVMRFTGGGAPTQESRKSGADGSFRVGGLEGKGFNLSAALRGFVETDLQGVDPAAGPVTVVLQRGGIVTGTVQDEEGKPVAAFTVSSKRTDAKNPRDPMGFMADMGGTEVKDEGGKFRLEGLAAGTYTITAKSGEFAPGRAADVPVQAGATAEVKIVLPAGLAISGIVVRKGEETPVAGASVSVAKPGPFGGMDVDFDMGDPSEDGSATDVEAVRDSMNTFGGGAGSVTTGADGRFVLKGLEAGTVDIKVKAKEYAPATQKKVPVPSEGEVRIPLADGAAVEGTVYDARKEPKSGAMVMLQKLPMTMKMATTDSKGHYRIGGLAPGKYLFYVMDNPGEMMGGGGGMNLKSESVTLEEGKTLAKDHRMGEGVKVTGKVTRGGKPVGGTMVVLLPGAGRKDASSALTGGSGFAMSTTKEDGTYEITGLAPGVYTAMVGMGNGGGPAPGDPVEIRPGATEVKRDIALARNAVRGIVVDGAGEPVQGAKVSAVVSGRNMTRVADLGEALSAVGGETTTGADGRFAMEDMNPGSFSVRATEEGKGSVTAENVVPSEEGTEIRLVLEKGVEVTVLVLDADGKPVAGAGIYLSDSRGMDLSGMEMFDTHRTGADGKAVVTAPPGTIHYEAVVKGHAPGTAVAAASSGAEVVINLPRGATLEVLVTDGGGSAVSGAAIRLLDAAGNPFASRMTMEGMGDLMSSPATGSDGKYSRADLPAGAYIVRASVGERSADASVTLAAGEKKSVTVRVP